MHRYQINGENNEQNEYIGVQDSIEYPIDDVKDTNKDK